MKYFSNVKLSKNNNELFSQLCSSHMATVRKKFKCPQNKHTVSNTKEHRDPRNKLITS